MVKLLKNKKQDEDDDGLLEDQPPATKVWHCRSQAPVWHGMENVRGCGGSDDNDLRLVLVCRVIANHAIKNNVSTITLARRGYAASR